MGMVARCMSCPAPQLLTGMPSAAVPQSPPPRVNLAATCPFSTTPTYAKLAVPTELPTGLHLGGVTHLPAHPLPGAERNSTAWP
eukprot:6193691-Pleurochrysis_carterae.AAC.2